MSFERIDDPDGDTPFTRRDWYVAAAMIVFVVATLTLLVFT